MTPLAILAFVRDHWRALGVGLGAAALVGLGWTAHARLRPCAVCAVSATETAHADTTSAASVDSTSHRGPSRVVTLNFDPAPPGSAAGPCGPIAVPGVEQPVTVPPGERLESVTIADDGAEDTTTHATAQEHSVTDRAVQIQVSPSEALPRFSVGWAPRVRPELGLGVVSGGVRLTRDVWIEAWAEPSVRAVGAGVRVTF